MLELNSSGNMYIGGYQITQELASTPYRQTLLGATASQTEQEQVVIKWYSALHMGSPRVRQEFLREVARLRRLQHPALLPIISAGIYTDTPYIVMPHMKKGSLYDRLQAPDGRIWARQRALALIQPLGLALACAHERQVVHGNIKFQNILLNERDEPILADFLLAALVSAQSPVITGVLSYYPALPPQYNPANDVYALACLAYELFAGRAPFPGSVESTPFPGNLLPLPPTRFDSGIAPYIEEALLRALFPHPDERYQDIKAFLRALEPPTALLPSVTSAREARSGPEQLPTVPIATVTGTLALRAPARALQEVSTVILRSLPAPHRAPLKVPRQTRRQPWSLFLLAGILCAVMFGLIGTQWLIRHPTKAPKQQVTLTRSTPERHQPVVTPTVAAQEVMPLLGYHSPTALATPQHWPTTPVKPTATATARPHPTRAASPEGVLLVRPGHLTAQTCTRSQLWYQCEVTLSLKENYSGVVTWEASTSGITAIMMPQRGILSPGESTHIVVQIGAQCPSSGALIFRGSDTSTQVAWSCQDRAS